MTRETWVIALGVLWAAVGCTNKDDGGDGGADATPGVSFQGLSPTAWSLSNANGEWQIALSDADQPHAAQGCALSADQHNGLGVAGGEIIIHLPKADDGSVPASPCPADNYTLQKCPNDLGTGAYVPAGCGFYRQFDATGAVLGTTGSLDGVVKIAGDEGACTMIVTVGFLGKSFTNQTTLNNSTAIQPWCVQNN